MMALWKPASSATSLYAAGPMDEVRRPSWTNLARLFNLLPRFVVWSIDESESESGASAATVST